MVLVGVHICNADISMHHRCVTQCAALRHGANGLGCGEEQVFQAHFISLRYGSHSCHCHQYDGGNQRLLSPACA